MVLCDVFFTLSSSFLVCLLFMLSGLYANITLSMYSVCRAVNTAKRMIPIKTHSSWDDTIRAADVRLVQLCNTAFDGILHQFFNEDIRKSINITNIMSVSLAIVIIGRVLVHKKRITAYKKLVIAYCIYTSFKTNRKNIY